MTSALHSWTSTNTYQVRVQARCATHPAVVSSWSASLRVTITTQGSSGTVTVPKGTYNGLFYDSVKGVSQQSAGSFTIATTTKGTFSGKLQLGKTRTSLSGRFDSTGRAILSAARNKSGAPVVELQLDPADPDHIWGAVSDEGHTFTAQLEGDRAVFDGRANVAPQQGLYTLVIPGGADSSRYPGGDSWGTLSVSTAGKVRLVGSLADGTKMSQSSTVSKRGDCPIYVPLYGGQGSFLSWLALGSSTINPLSGQLGWVKPAQAKTKCYAQGFLLMTDVWGSRYVRPPKGSPVLSFTDMDVVLSGGGLTAAITNHVVLGPGNKVTSADNKTKLSFASNSGSFRGSVPNPAGGKSGTISFTGVVLTDAGEGHGYFLGTDQSGQVLLRGR